MKSKAKAGGLLGFWWILPNGLLDSLQAEQVDKANQILAKWFFCALSKVCHWPTVRDQRADRGWAQRPLEEPIVSCALGKLYNKDAIIEYRIDKTAYGDGEAICRHIRSLKVDYPVL